MLSTSVRNCQFYGSLHIIRLQGDRGFHLHQLSEALNQVLRFNPGSISSDFPVVLTVWQDWQVHKENMNSKNCYKLMQIPQQQISIARQTVALSQSSHPTNIGFDTAEASLSLETHWWLHGEAQLLVVYQLCGIATERLLPGAMGSKNLQCNQ